MLTPKAHPLSGFNPLTPGSGHCKLPDPELTASQLRSPPVATLLRKIEFSIVTAVKVGKMGAKSARLLTKVLLRTSPLASKSAATPHGPLA